jgi:hypothetical protein
MSPSGNYFCRSNQVPMMYKGNHPLMPQSKDRTRQQ